MCWALGGGAGLVEAWGGALRKVQKEEMGPGFRKPSTLGRLEPGRVLGGGFRKRPESWRCHQGGASPGMGGVLRRNSLGCSSALGAAPDLCSRHCLHAAPSLGARGSTGQRSPGADHVGPVSPALRDTEA